MNINPGKIRWPDFNDWGDRADGDRYLPSHERGDIHPPKRREPERWELYTHWTWAIHRGIWHVATDVSLFVNHEYRAWLACKGEHVPAMCVTVDTGYHLKNSDDRGFCRKCRAWIEDQLDAMGFEPRRKAVSRDRR